MWVTALNHDRLGALLNNRGKSSNLFPDPGTHLEIFFFGWGWDLKREYPSLACPTSCLFGRINGFVGGLWTMEDAWVWDVSGGKKLSVDDFANKKKLLRCGESFERTPCPQPGRTVWAPPCSPPRGKARHNAPSDQQNPQPYSQSVLTKWNHYW